MSIRGPIREATRGLVSSPIAGVFIPAWEDGTYGLGDKVRHDGKLWVSTASNNLGEPGVSGWNEL